MMYQQTTMEKQTYTARFSLNIRSDDSDRKLPDGSMYVLYYKKTAELPFPTAPGISILTWKPTRIKEVIIHLPLHGPTQIHADRSFSPQMNADKHRCKQA